MLSSSIALLFAAFSGWFVLLVKMERDLWSDHTQWEGRSEEYAADRARRLIQPQNQTGGNMNRGSWMSEDYLDLSIPITMVVQVKTSHAYLADTEDNITISFIGSFSGSEPFILNPDSPLERGTTHSISLEMMQIGVLQQVILENHGRDGWLLAELVCRENMTVYELNGPRQWLDRRIGLKLVPHEYGEQYGVPIELVPNAGKSGLLHYSKIPFDPFEPNAQEQLDGRSKLTLTVTNSVKLTYPLGYIHGEKPDRGYN